jgi:protein tyrosine phosphatase
MSKPRTTPRYVMPRKTRTGVCVALDRFRQVTAIIRGDYDLTPEINAEIDAVARMLETLRKTRR